MLNWFDRIGNIGVKENYDSWEVYLTRKLNFLTLLGILNVSCTIIFFILIDFRMFIPECIITLLVAPFVIILNYKKNYIWSAYLFYLIGIVLFYVLTLKMGLDTYIILFYFPVIISLVQILGRKETIKHLLIILSLFFISIVILTFDNQATVLSLEKDLIIKLRGFNIISSFFLTIVLISVLTIENIKQESVIKNVLREKEILLAEVFHRVKNNMNIVTSLLNLKKEISDSEEVKQAIEECRERVYSMALVHQKIYNNKSIHSLDFKDYVTDLVTESVNSTGGSENIDVVFDLEQVNLPINYAIPCGLILNEIITNSFKHAQIKEQKLKLEIGLSESNKQIILIVKDNGPGFDFNKTNKQNSLGIDLIKSLGEQIEAKISVTNDNGTLFKIEFQRN